MDCDLARRQRIASVEPKAAATAGCAVGRAGIGIVDGLWRWRRFANAEYAWNTRGHVYGDGHGHLWQRDPHGDLNRDCAVTMKNWSAHAGGVCAAATSGERALDTSGLKPAVSWCP
jgi:hypothetical protein